MIKLSRDVRMKLENKFLVVNFAKVPARTTQETTSTASIGNKTATTRKIQFFTGNSFCQVSCQCILHTLYIFIYVYIYIYIYLYIYIYIYIYIYLSIYLFIYLSIYLYICMYAHLNVFVKVCMLKCKNAVFICFASLLSNKFKVNDIKF